MNNEITKQDLKELKINNKEPKVIRLSKAVEVKKPEYLKPDKNHIANKEFCDDCSAVIDCDGYAFTRYQYSLYEHRIYCEGCASEREFCQVCEDFAKKDDIDFDDHGEPYCLECQDENYGSWTEREADEKANRDYEESQLKLTENKGANNGI